MAAVVIKPTATVHTATLIFLHGLGDTGHGWASILQEVVPAYCKLVCPHAPSIPVTLNGGMRMPAWFDIRGLSPNAEQDEIGIERGRDMVEKLIAEETAAGLPVSRLVIGGFSMGGALALFSGLTSSKASPAGIVALSSWLPLHHKLLANPGLVLNRPAVFQAHGDSDQMVPHVMGDMTHKLMRQMGLSQAQFKSYPGLMHSSSDQEMADMKQFLEKLLPPVEAAAAASAGSGTS